MTTQPPVRIAAVQHGDYREALEIIGSGRPETYSGMANTLSVLDALIGDSPHLVVSLNCSAYRAVRGRGMLVGLPAPRRLRPLPGTVTAWLWGRRICAELAAFRPTHVLLRTGGFLGWYILRFCIRRKLNVLALFANTMGERPRWLTRRLETQTVEYLNHPLVFLVGNHRPPAAQQLIERGVDASKVVAYDWPLPRQPQDYPAKLLRPDVTPNVVYVGSIRSDKGIEDLLEAVRILQQEGRAIRLTIIGDGPLLPSLRQQVAERSEHWITILGRRSNDEAFAAMRDATIVCVPSRHVFAEGLPFTLTEALTSRTPVVASDHPVFVRGFVDGQGIRFFPERNPLALASVLRRLLDHPEEYRQLSESTEKAFDRVRCSATFGDLIMRWKATFTPTDASVHHHPQLPNA